MISPPEHQKRNYTLNVPQLNPKSTPIQSTFSFCVILAVLPLLMSFFCGCGTSLQHRGKVTLTFPDQHTETRGAYWKLDLAAGKANIESAEGTYTNEFDTSGFMEDFSNKGKGIKSEGTIEGILKELVPLAQSAIQAYLNRPTETASTSKTTVQEWIALLQQLQQLGTTLNLNKTGTTK